ncbi:hypothetical protein THERMOS_92 [Bathymodiolus thermophilus thioautotrophic gill symbiont]|uniref:Uncharacterized protein n=1 Tax=Bathymodiolus thermophilus thioautotrophic gill symbiont TaxID=2360 RepID=A0A8H8XAT5_9GAMM|nr:hypothetical protein THERMOS_92 [Bathymodiolus thermophilus thioautotrophic gill symbiont]
MLFLEGKHFVRGRNGYKPFPTIGLAFLVCCWKKLLNG